MAITSVSGIALALASPLLLAACVAGPIPETNGSAVDRAFAERGLRTDTSSRTVELDGFVGGGPGKDGIPALADPDFVELDDSTIPDDVRGVLVEIAGEARFYPYNVMVWHEVVNDEIAGTPVTVTF